MTDYAIYSSNRKILRVLDEIPDQSLELAIKLLTERKQEWDARNVQQVEFLWAGALEREASTEEVSWLDPTKSPRSALLATLATMVEQHEASADVARAEAATFLGRMKRAASRVWKSNRP